MLKNRRKIFVICIIVLIVAAITIFVATGNFANLVKRISTLQKLKGTPEFSYDVYSNENNKIIVSIKAVDVDGIKQIEYPNNGLALYCNGKQTVSLDYEIQEQTDYTFKVTNENDEIKTHTVRIDNLDDYIKIDVSSEKELGTEAKINITFGTEGTTNQYAIGKNNTNWNLYENEIDLDSYTIIENNWGNEDFTTTIKAKATDDAGNIIEIERIITCLDIDIANEPVIIQTSTEEYATITEYGVKLNSAVQVEYDTRDDITNYYSLDNGNTWNEYISDFTTQKSKVIAKSVKNTSGLQTIKTTILSPSASDALGGEAYDEDDDTSINDGYGIIKYINIDDSMIENSIEVDIYNVRCEYWSPSINFIFLNLEDEELQQNNYGVTSNHYIANIEVPSNTKRLKIIMYEGRHRNGSVPSILYEIRQKNTPTINNQKYYPILHSQGVQPGYNEVTIEYFQTSIDRLYKINDSEWKEYENKPIRLEIGDVIQAKGIDKSGIETKRIETYTAILPEDAMDENAYDGNLETYITIANAPENKKYIELDSSLVGTEIKISASHDFWEGMSLSLENENHKEIETYVVNPQAQPYGGFEKEFVITSNSKYLVFYSSGSNCILKEIEITDSPTFNVEKHYPVITAEAILPEYYNEVTINYFRTSVQRLYSFDETTWQTYNGETINLETSKKIYAKGIDEYGKETKVVSYESELSDAIPEEVYDGNLDTGFGSWNPMYMKVDSSAIGKKIRLHIKNGYNDGSYCTGYVELLNKEKESIYHNDFYVRVEDYLEDVEILEGTKFVKIYAGRKYIYNRNRTY